MTFQARSSDSMATRVPSELAGRSTGRLQVRVASSVPPASVLQIPRSSFVPWRCVAKPLIAGELVMGGAGKPLAANVLES